MPLPADLSSALGFGSRSQVTADKGKRKRKRNRKRKKKKRKTKQTNAVLHPRARRGDFDSNATIITPNGDSRYDTLSIICGRSRVAL